MSDAERRSLNRSVQERRQWMDAALEGDISEADFLRLEAELSVDPAARREYLERVQLSLLLESEARPRHSQPISSVKVARRSARGWRWAFAAMATVCAGLLVMVSWQWGAHDPPHAAPRKASISADATASEPQASGYAILAGQVDAVWKGSSPTSGTVVPPGELHLTSGLAQFELFSGVTMVVEGEARFSILSPMEVSVAAGKVRARVPEPVQGFRLLTDAGEVVDLGTEFAVHVADGSSEVHVLDGAVEWHPAGFAAQRLEQGQAARRTPSGQEVLSANADAFVGMADLQDRLRMRRQSRREAWEQAVRARSSDPRLVVQYQMTPEGIVQRSLPNLGTSPAAVASAGAIVAASAAPNRWGQPESALDFSPAGSRVRLHVPGVYHNLTLVCWVRINSLDRWYNSLFLTDGHEQGEPHWQIMDDGRLFFSVKKRDVFDKSKGEKDKHVFYSPPFWNSSLSGRWLMLATVYDGANMIVTHYLNGEVLSREAIPPEYLVTEIRIGDASLCNWGLPERNQPRFAIRNLNGSMDEFLLYREALPDEEIRALYQIGKP